jgi:hypothetical protein
MLNLLCGPGVISQDTHPEGARDGCSQSGRDAFSEGSENVFEFFAKRFSESRNPLGVCRVMRSVSGIEKQSGRRSRITSAAGRGLFFPRGV